MSLPVFIADLDAVLEGTFAALPEAGQAFTLTGPEGRHAVSVKRIAVGEKIALVDGRGGRAIAEVTATRGKDILEARIVEREELPAPTPTVTVIQALPKSERSELAVDLLTQGGADRIVPWEASRCVAKWQGAKRGKGVQKWRQAAIAAAKQSRRPRLPEVTEPMSTAQVAAMLGEFDLVLILHEEAAAPIAQVPLDRAGSIAVIIGPEGGVSPEEVEQLTRAGATAVKLGPEVLRTASAGIVALAAIGVRTDRW